VCCCCCGGLAGALLDVEAAWGILEEAGVSPAWLESEGTLNPSEAAPLPSSGGPLGAARLLLLSSSPGSCPGYDADAVPLVLPGYAAGAVPLVPPGWRVYHWCPPGWRVYHRCSPGWKVYPWWQQR